MYLIIDKVLVRILYLNFHLCRLRLLWRSRRSRFGLHICRTWLCDLARLIIPRLGVRHVPVGFFLLLRSWGLRRGALSLFTFLDHLLGTLEDGLGDHTRGVLAILDLLFDILDFFLEGILTIIVIIYSLVDHCNILKDLEIV